MQAFVCTILKTTTSLRYRINFISGVEEVCLTASDYFSEVFTQTGPIDIIPFSFGMGLIPY